MPCKLLTILSTILVLLFAMNSAAEEVHIASLMPNRIGSNESSLVAPYSSATMAEHQLWTSSGKIFHSAVAGYIAGTSQHTLLNMPKNARQSAEGYWIGAHPTCKQLKTMYAARIRLIVTAALFEREQFGELPQCIQNMGFKHLNIPFGARFPQPSRFINVIRQYKPFEIYIHCEHGGDRSGALLAYLLISEHGWPIHKALLAVLFPGLKDLNNLRQIFETRNIDLPEEDVVKYLGLYSGEYNNGYGGLKIRSDGYRKLINTMLDYALKRQAELALRPLQ